MTISDNGISEAVDKVYDSVVVVSNYKDKTLYATGSGFIYKVDDNDTYIVTNHHVIDGGTNYKITYTDNEVVDAILVGSSELSDIAVLKVETRANYNSAIIGTTTNLKAGDTTFVVGAPLDSNTYSWTVTRGIISGKERLVPISLTSYNQIDYIMNVLQTDAAVNSGNSGGPLCNSNGEVIGVISSKIASTGVEGMGFAIPIEEAIETVEEILANGEVTYPYLEITMLNVKDIKNNRRYYQYLENIDGIESGVLILDIEENSSLSNTNIEIGDVITKINKKQVIDIAYLRYELYKYKVGEEIEITYIHNNEEKTTKVLLKEAKKEKNI